MKTLILVTQVIDNMSVGSAVLFWVSVGFDGLASPAVSGRMTVNRTETYVLVGTTAVTVDLVTPIHEHADET